jgi:stringent starvation protein B
MAIYARENGQGMAFPVQDDAPEIQDAAASAPEAPEPPPAPTTPGHRPALKRIK